MKIRIYKQHFPVIFPQKTNVPGHFGLKAAVDRDPSSAIQFNTNRLKAEVLAEGAAPNAHQQNVTNERLVLATGSCLHAEHTKQ